MPRPETVPLKSPTGQRSTMRSAHLPRTLAQVLSETNEQVVSGDLSGYAPIPSGFDPRGQLAQQKLIDEKVIES